MIIDGTAAQNSADVTPAVASLVPPEQVTPVYIDAPFASGSAPALRGGASGSNAPALRGGASRTPSAPPYSPPPTAEIGAAWHVAVGEGSQGPYTIDELASYVADGRIANDTLVYCDSFADWTPAGAVEELMLAASALRRPRPSAPPPPPPQLTPSPYQRSVGMGRDPFAEREHATASSPRLRAEEIFDSKHEGTVQFSLDDMRAISAVSSPGLMPSLPTSPGSYMSTGYSAPGYASGGDSGLIDVSALSAAGSGPYRSIGDTHVSPLESHITPMAVPILGRAPGLDMRTKVLAGLSTFGFVLVAGVAVLAMSHTPAAQPVNVASAAQPIAQAGIALAPVVVRPEAAPVVEPVAKTEPEPAPAADEPRAAARDDRAFASADRTSKKGSRMSPAASRDRKHNESSGNSTSNSDRAGKNARHGHDDLPLAKASASDEAKPSKSGAKAASSSPDIDELLASAPTKKPPKGGSASIDDLLDGAVSAKKQAPKNEPAEAKSDLPMTPSRDDMLSALGKAKAKAAKCKGDGVATADISIAGSGHVTSVTVSGAEGSTKSCVENAVKSTSFPKFQKETFQVKFPFKLAG